jgi:hypothetical protein
LVHRHHVYVRVRHKWQALCEGLLQLGAVVVNHGLRHGRHAQHAHQRLVNVDGVGLRARGKEAHVGHYRGLEVLGHGARNHDGQVKGTEQRNV